MKELKTSLKITLNLLEKYRKVQNFFSFNRTRKVDNNGNEDITTVSYKIKLTNSAKFMTSSLWNLVDNLAEGIHKIKCKDRNCFLEYKSVNENLIKYKCLSFNENYSNKIDEKLKKRFKNTFKFSNNDINKFIFSQRGLSLEIYGWLGVI